MFLERLEDRCLLSSSPPILSAHPNTNAAFVKTHITWNGQDAEVAAGSWILSLGGLAGDPTHQLRAARALVQNLEIPSSLSLTRCISRRGVFVVNAPPETKFDALNAALKTLPGFRYLEPNFVVRAESIPDDPRFGELWGLNNTGQTGGTPDTDIDAPEAWDISIGSASAVVVGVIDTGVDYSHPDLADNMWTNLGEVPDDHIDNDGNGYVDDVHGYDFYLNFIDEGDSDPMDEDGHGTHVSGTIGGVGNNGEGVAGVNWQTQIMALKFLGPDGSGYDADAVEAINYATMMHERGVNIRLTSNSWGGNGFAQSLYDAIQDSGEAGLLFVAAAGNDGANNDKASPKRIFAPASFDLDNIIAVAATDHEDHLAYFSNFGATTVDLGAPGVDILSARLGSGYVSYSGTSMATPHVSGVAALAWSVAEHASYQQVRDAIFLGVDPIADLNGVTVTGGRLNAFNTLQMFDLEASKRFDFDGKKSPTAAGHLRVLPYHLFSPADGFGWESTLKSFDTKAPNALLRDGHRGAGGNTFRIQMSPGAAYTAVLYFHDKKAHQSIDVSADGTRQIDHLNTPKRGTELRFFSGVVDGDGILDLRFDADEEFVVNALELYAPAGNFTSATTGIGASLDESVLDAIVQGRAARRKGR